MPLLSYFALEIDTYLFKLRKIDRFQIKINIQRSKKLKGLTRNNIQDQLTNLSAKADLSDVSFSLFVLFYSSKMSISDREIVRHFHGVVIINSNQRTTNSRFMQQVIELEIF